MRIRHLLGVFLERLKAVEDRNQANTDQIKRELDLIKSIPLSKQGETGAVGPQGDQGPEGLQGRQGEKGPVGPEGPKGPRGPKGDKGTQGGQGVQGKEGKSGPKGPKGDKGEKGNTGVQGKQGKDGKDGRLPRHKIHDGKVAFEISPGRYGDWITFKQVNQYYSGGGGGEQTVAGLKWIDYVSNYASSPVFEASIAAGDVYRYSYINGTLYRLIGSNPYSDRFYNSFNGSAVSGLVIERQMAI